MVGSPHNENKNKKVAILCSHAVQYINTCYARPPMDYIALVQVINGGHYLSDEFSHFSLVQIVLLIDVLHELPTRAKLCHKVVTVVCLYHFQQLDDIGMTNLLQQSGLPAHVLCNITVVF